MDRATETLLPECDAEGYLVEPGDWNEEVAVALAIGENLVLNEDHWDAIRFMRDYYDEHQIAPDRRRRAFRHQASRRTLRAR